MTTDFQRKITEAGIYKHNDVPEADRDRSIRLYCTSSAEVHGAEASYSLQIRARVRIANMSEGKDFAIATATLRLEDLIALNAATEEAIAEIYRGLGTRNKRSPASALTRPRTRKRS